MVIGAAGAARIGEWIVEPSGDAVARDEPFAVARVRRADGAWVMGLLMAEPRLDMWYGLHRRFGGFYAQTEYHPTARAALAALLRGHELVSRLDAQAARAAFPSSDDEDGDDDG